MKIIPKNTKPKNYIWKKITLLDTIIALVFLLVVIAIITSNISKKYILASVVFVFAIILLLPVNPQRIYQEIFQIIKYLSYKKKYKEKDIDKLLAFKDIDEEGYIIYPSYFGRVIEIGSKNFALLDDIEQDFDIENFSNALNCIPNNETIDLVKIDKALILDDYIKNLYFQIENEKNEERKKILYSKLSDIDVLNDNEEPIYINKYYMVFYSNKKEDLESQINIFLENIEELKIKTKILNKKETAIFLKYSFSRDFNEREIDDIDEKDLIKWIKPKSITFKSNSFLIDNKYAFNLTIEDYPIEVGAGFLAKAFNQEGIKAIMHISCVDQEKSIKRVDKAINEIKTRQEQDIQKVSEEIKNETHIDTMCNLLVSLQNENEKLFDVSVNFVAYNYNNLPVKVFRKKVFSFLRNQSLKVNNLSFRQQEGFLNQNLSRSRNLKNFERGINSSSLASSFVFVDSQINDKNGSYLGITENKKPFILDIFKRDENHTNSNAFIIGSSGSGKSYFLKTLLSHIYANKTKIFILDPEDEYSILANNLGGKIIDVGKGNKERINPFHIYPVISDSENQDDKETDLIAIFNSHLRMLESFFKIILPGITQEALEILNYSIVKTYEQKGIGPGFDFTKLSEDKFPIFDDLIFYINNLFEKEENIYKRNIFLSILTYITKFGKNGIYNDLWNGKTTIKIDSDFTVFNFQNLFSSKNDLVANAQMLLIFRFLEQQIINQKNENEKNKDLQKRIAIIVDEAHMFIDSKFPIALDFMYQMTKRIRKYGGSFIPATQSISDWLSTEELRNKTTAILKNSQYNFVFKLKSLDAESLVDLYRSLKPINDVELKSITKAKVGNCFAILSEEIRESFYVDANDYIKNLFEEKIDKDDLEEFLKENKKDENK